MRTSPRKSLISSTTVPQPQPDRKTRAPPSSRLRSGRRRSHRRLHEALAGIESERADIQADYDAAVAGTTADYNEALAGIEEECASIQQDYDEEVAGVAVDFEAEIRDLEREWKDADGADRREIEH
jgi:hypothetical protein